MVTSATEDFQHALRSFAPAALTQNSIIALMRPSDFLRLASPLSQRIIDQHRERNLLRLRETGKRFATLPELTLALRKHDADVVMHDGRHRVIILQDQGLPIVPVMLHVESEDNTVLSNLKTFEYLLALKYVFPQRHDDDETYPEFSEEALDTRLEPMKASEIFANLFSVTESLEGKTT